MTQTLNTEQTRIALQDRLDGKKTQAERNRLGQFATPTALAHDILVYARTLCRDEPSIRFLDPAFGTGSFYAALRDIFPEHLVTTATGFEIDPHYAEPAQVLWRDTPLDLRLADFTQTGYPENESDKYNLIICNPPYVRHHHIVNGEKQRLQHQTERVCGVRINGLAGLYCYFMGLAHAWMTKNGIAGWLIPSEFMDVKYGESVKQYLLNKVTLLRIHRFDPQEVQFGDALVSSVVVWFKNTKPAQDHRVTFSFGGSLHQPAVSKEIPVSFLRRERKWSRYPLEETPKTISRYTLGDLFTIKRGIATGNNKYFILTQDDIESRDLPMECFRPILPSPRELKQDEIKADKDGNPKVEAPRFVLDCKLSEREIGKAYPALWTYLKEGKTQGVHERYLCRHRSPWYAQEQRPPAPILCTYMGRTSTDGKHPFRFILNHSQATAPNVYLMLYPKPLIAQAIQDDPMIIRRIWEMLMDILPEDLLGEGRVYGGGLHKIEPKELANVPVDSLSALIDKVMQQPGQQLALYGEVASQLRVVQQ